MEDLIGFVLYGVFEFFACVLFDREKPTAKQLLFTYLIIFGFIAFLIWLTVTYS